MSKDLDDLLRLAPARPPANFTDRVMEEVGRNTQLAPPRRWRTLAQEFALIAAAALGAAQVFAFIFGLWAVTAVGAA